MSVFFEKQLCSAAVALNGGDRTLILKRTKGRIVVTEF
jgi:hypothetical protein